LPSYPLSLELFFCYFIGLTFFHASTRKSYILRNELKYNSVLVSSAELSTGFPRVAWLKLCCSKQFIYFYFFSCPFQSYWLIYSWMTICISYALWVDPRISNANIIWFLLSSNADRPPLHYIVYYFCLSLCQPIKLLG
jgi:hypothetical protein